MQDSNDLGHPVGTAVWVSDGLDGGWYSEHIAG